MYIPDVFRALADEEGTLAGEEPFRSRFGGSRAEYERWRHFLIWAKTRIESRMGEVSPVAWCGVDLAYFALWVLSFYWTVWEASIVPRFFWQDEIFATPLAVEDLAELLHENTLGHFLPYLGSLEDEEILTLRRLTASERLGYLAHILGMVGEMDDARKVSDMGEVHRMVSDRVKTRVLPAFVQYARSLEGQRKAKKTRFGERMVGAFAVDASVTSPKYWLTALKSLLDWNADDKREAAEDCTNERQFLTFLGRVHSWSGSRTVH